MPVTVRGCLPDERESMTQPPAARTPAGSRSAVAAHPVISAVIAVLIIAAVFFSLYVPLYASATPKVGDFPFFYFFLIIYMPVVGIVLGIVLYLQSRLRTPSDTDAGTGTGTGTGTGRPGEVTR
jgi:hypothetical protein